MEQVQVIGIEKLEDDEKDVLKKLIEKYHKKVKRELKNVTSLTIHVKTHSKGGKSKKYDVRVKVAAPTSIFEAQGSDWDLARTLHTIFKSLIRQIQHKLRTDNQKL